MQATTAQPAPQAPAAPLAPVVAGGAAPVAAPVVVGIPQTVGELRALRAERKEISSQLDNVGARRARLSASLGGKTGVDRAGVEARIGVLDKRMLQLESQLDQTGQQLAMAPGTLTNAADLPRFTNMDPDAVAALSGIFIIFVLAPIAFAAARMMWKRTNRPVAAPLPDEASRRLERLEQGMDAIAIEIERVSEGQRFVTRLLSDAHGAPLPVSQRIAEQTRTE
jgi:hypothetical protein